MSNRPTPDSQSIAPVSEPSNSLSPWRSLWSLDPTVVFLNHGSFGACPIAVLQHQQRLRAQMEAAPLRFFEDQLEPMLDAARLQLAKFVGADAAQLAFVPNATTGVNTVLQALALRPGDELLTTNHEYNASRNALDAVAQRTGATVVVADLPFPIASPVEVIEAICHKATRQTRLVLLDHVTSQTALVLPIEPLVAELNQRGIDVLVDGAHAPGMLPLNLKQIGVTYYTGNCHKWLCSPKGAAFLYVREDRQAAIRPLVISHGANSPRGDRSRFHLEFDWTGTVDPTAYLCVPEAIQFMSSLLPQGWSELMSHNRSTTLAARQQLCQGLGLTPPCPEEMIGSMAVIPLPTNGIVQSAVDWADLQLTLFRQFRIEVPVIPWQPYAGVVRRLIRISAQLYNTQADYEVLTTALVELLAAEQGLRG